MGCSSTIPQEHSQSSHVLQLKEFLLWPPNSTHFYSFSTAVKYHKQILQTLCLKSPLQYTVLTIRNQKCHGCVPWDLPRESQGRNNGSRLVITYCVPKRQCPSSFLPLVELSSIFEDKVNMACELSARGYSRLLSHEPWPSSLFTLRLLLHVESLVFSASGCLTWIRSGTQKGF